MLVGCFGEPGCIALRELAGVPVIGLAEAAMREAAQPYIASREPFRQAYCARWVMGE